MCQQGLVWWYAWQELLRVKIGRVISHQQDILRLNATTCLVEEVEGTLHTRTHRHAYTRRQTTHTDTQKHTYTTTQGHAQTNTRKHRDFVWGCRRHSTFDQTHPFLLGSSPTWWGMMLQKALLRMGQLSLGGNHGDDDCDDVGNSLVANGAIILKR